MAHDKRSRMVTQGIARAPNRSIFLRWHYRNDDFDKPMATNDVPCESTAAAGSRRPINAWRDVGNRMGGTSAQMSCTHRLYERARRRSASADT